MLIKNSEYRSGSSYGERFVERCLSQVLDDIKSRDKQGGFEYDISSKNFNINIEYSGENWHVGREDHDELKRKYCRDNSIRYIEIIEASSNVDDSKISGKNYIKFTMAPCSFSCMNKKLRYIVAEILEWLGFEVVDIDYKRACYEALALTKKYKYNIVYDSRGNIQGTKNINFNFLGKVAIDNSDEHEIIWNYHNSDGTLLKTEA